jgi:pyridoxine/pyridoxamine 5'-phosphate oxidase
VLVFPIRVAAWYRAMLVPALLVVGLLALIVMSVIRYYAATRQDESLAAWASRQSNRIA